MPSGPQPIDGKSLVPVLIAVRKASGRTPTTVFLKERLGRAVRTSRYRLVEWKPFGSDDDPEYELYDYQEDPLETEKPGWESPRRGGASRRDTFLAPAGRSTTKKLVFVSVGKKGSDTKSRNGPSGASHFWCLTPFSQPTPKPSFDNALGCAGR